MLSHLAVFSAQGPEAGAFLQGQLTQDVLSMTPSQARAGGYCSAKGRLLGTFIIVNPERETWWFITDRSVAPALVKRLKMFVLRAKCIVSERPDLSIDASGDEGLAPWEARVIPSSASPSQAPQVRIGWFGGRTMIISATPAEAGRDDGGHADPESLRPSSVAAPEPTELAWRHADIQAGWPWIEAAAVEQFVPQMVNFEVLGGVNFRKGCYPGQEVVARSQYRGTLKRRMALYRVTAAAPAAGTEVFDAMDPDQPAGMVVNAAADPTDPRTCLLLAEVKIAAQASGPLHLASPQGPALQAQALPYRVPTESEM